MAPQTHSHDSSVSMLAMGSPAPRRGGARSPFGMMDGSIHEHQFKVGQSVSFASAPCGRGDTNGNYKATSCRPKAMATSTGLRAQMNPERVAKECQLDRTA
jgi:hypothetical protein